MGRYFDEVMRLSKAGYIDNLKDVREITDRLVNCTLDKLVVPGFDTIGFGTWMVAFFPLPRENVQALRFMDLLNMLRVLHLETGSPECAAMIKIVLMMAKEYIVNVKLFMAVPIASLAELMNERSGTKKCSKVFESLKATVKKCLDFTITETTTVNQLFEQFDWSLTHWDPPKTLCDFIENTYNCCEVIKILMVDFFRIGYSEMFAFSDMKDRLTAGRDDWRSDDYDREYGTRYDDVSYDFVSYEYVYSLKGRRISNSALFNNLRIIAENSAEHNDNNKNDSESSE